VIVPVQSVQEEAHIPIGPQKVWGGKEKRGYLSLKLQKSTLSSRRVLMLLGKEKGPRNNGGPPQIIPKRNRTVKCTYERLKTT